MIPYTPHQRWLFWIVTFIPGLVFTLLLIPAITVTVLAWPNAFARIIIWIKKLEGWYGERIP